MNRVIYGIYDRYASKKVATIIAGFILLSYIFEQSITLVGTDPEGQRQVCMVAMGTVGLIVFGYCIGQGIGDMGKTNLVPKALELDQFEEPEQSADLPAQ